MELFSVFCVGIIVLVRFGDGVEDFSEMMEWEWKLGVGWEDV